MALDPRFVVTSDLEGYFVSKETGLPLANGILTFYEDSARTVLKPIYQLSGAPPYNIDSYVPLPNPLTLSSVGTPQNASGDNIVIYYFPFDGTPNNSQGISELYFITVQDENGEEQFTREAWPNIGANSISPEKEPPTAGSYLIGWDFTVNPYQFGTSGTVFPMSTVTRATAYIADQTIAESATSNVTWTVDPITNGLKFTGTGTNDAFYLMQYLDGALVQKLLGTTLSVNVFGYQDGALLPITMQIYLFRGSSAAMVPTLPATIGTVASDGTFTLTAANWDAIPRGGSSIPIVNLSQVLTNSDINNISNNYGFNGWQIIDNTDIGNTDLFAMVVTFAYKSVSSVFTINSISLVPGDTPSRPIIKSADDTLRECQYYYEKSYAPTTPPGTATNVGARVFNFPLAVVGGSDILYPKSFQLNYQTVKRILSGAPTIPFFSLSGASGNLTASITNGGTIVVTNNVPQITNWLRFGESIYGVELLSSSVNVLATTATSSSNEGKLQFHYVIDRRLGII